MPSVSEVVFKIQFQATVSFLRAVDGNVQSEIMDLAQFGRKELPC